MEIKSLIGSFILGVAAGLLISLIIINSVALSTLDKVTVIGSYTSEYKEAPIPKEPTFIWNDDIESLPTDGSPILIEFTSKDTIYIGPYEHNQITYKH